MYASAELSSRITCVPRFLLNQLPRNKKGRKNATLYDAEITDLLRTVRSGTHMTPQDSLMSGTGGVYFLKDDSDNNIAVFKPYDEEAIPATNEQEDARVGDIATPIGKEIKPGLVHGEGYLKEVAAYLIDRDHFYGVPTTTLYSCVQPSLFVNSPYKIGSLQKYVPHICTVEEMGWNVFPVDEVHKIGVLDCRILNTDRHMGNMLVAKGDDGCYRLVPIDHGLSLPSTLSCAYFEWLSMVQCRQPFSRKTIEHISKIDVDSDLQILQSSLPDLRQECLFTLKICTIFLKKAAMCGMTLYQIGCMMSRYLDPDEPSELEKIKAAVDERVVQRGNTYDFWEILDDEINKLLYYNHI